MLNFSIKLLPGQPIYEQITYAVKKALVSGQLKPGDRFPAVRTVSQALNVNPNTVQRAVSDLTTQGILQVYPGQGCFIAEKVNTSKEIQTKVLTPLIEQLLIEVEQNGMTEEELHNLIKKHWKALRQKEGRIKE
jgi:GntR family transcriptional regulator